MKDLSGLEIKDYFRIFWKRRWYWLIVWALVSIGGTYYARQRPDVYRSEAKVAVDIPLSAVTRTSTSVNERVETIREQLSSRSFLERMIMQTGSYGWGDSDDFVMERALKRIRDNIRITPSGRMFTVAYRATDAMVAQNVTKQFTDELIRISRRSSEDRVRTVDRFVEGKFLESEENLRQISEKIREFRQRNAGRLPENVISNMNAVAGYRAQLSSLDNSIMQARNQKENLEYRYEQSRDIQNKLNEIPAPPVIPVISNESSSEERELARKMDSLYEYEEKLRQALEKWTENHPEVGLIRREISRLEREIEELRVKVAFVNVPSDSTQDGDASNGYKSKIELEKEFIEQEYRRQLAIYEADIAKKEQERGDLLKKINETEAMIRLSPTLEADYNDLLREEELANKEYQNYAAQKLNAGIATAVETDKDNEVYRVIDEANFPYYPEGANRMQLIMMSLFGGFALGIAAAFGRELIDSTIGSEEEAKKVFKLPVLAAIPAAPSKIKKTELRKVA